jgi:hypothetical protein
MADNITESPIEGLGRKEPIKGCINRNFCSSTLFLVPAIYASIVNYSNVMWGSLICFLTSTAHHYYQAQNKILRIIDVVCVNSIAAYFVIYCFMYIGSTFYSNIVYGFAFAALVFYLYLLFKPHLYAKYHCLVHILAITGIMFYIKAYTEYANVRKESVNKPYTNEPPDANEPCEAIK